MRVLITGLCGFIGHHLCAAVLRHTDWQIVGLDRLDATSTLHRLYYIPEWRDAVGGDRVRFVWHDLRAPVPELTARRIGQVDAILHLAASTHVDRSISDALQFVHDNVVGTAHVLEYARTQPLRCFLNFGTDEVFGTAAPGVAFREHDGPNPTNPYAASKLAAEAFVTAYCNTYGVPAVTTRCMNVVGERQHHEKFVPLLVGRILKGQRVLLHANRTKTIAGSRGYVYAGNTARAVIDVVNAMLEGRMRSGESLHLPAQAELTNIEMLCRVAELLDRPLPPYELVDFHDRRPGHDLRYALDGTKFHKLGLEYGVPFDEGLAATVRWYAQHPEWLEA